ncbi:exodeoxyribonuclease VII small subunit [Ureibacillus acetophenoni]|uniref:Exodeoxyribonuclease 7 small subunit n=1 Tax=Ureibacillus acetophenoni TaxID=614649 RepID=A0A285U2E1_9BACL|nr:exodeoxyribonuclease VII small subunit [Ureibacillus acetophenoni]SOC36130.1 exodeoxyribonuclease VII small subunit [Ureibacillus acetophenoni]
MTKQQTFAEAMAELEEIVQKLEQGEVPLEEAIDLYKKGMELSQFCHVKLQNAEEQLISVVNENGEKQPFDQIGDRGLTE